MNTSTNKQINSVKEIKTYQDFVDRFDIEMILCNDILNDDSFEFESGEFCDYYDENGNKITYEEYENDENAEEYPKEIMQNYIVSDRSAEYLMEYTDEIVWYSDKFNLYVWSVTHCGSSWSIVPMNTLYQ